MAEMNVDYCCGLKWQYATVEVHCQGTVSLRDNVLSSDHTENILLQYFYVTIIEFTLCFILVHFSVMCEH
jgi:hypothetical protein